jgi:choline dehydrogenase-like flavoprotein
LSAGSIGTPHILLNSGIGSKAALQAVGIKCLVDNPSVGANLTDHPLVGNSWFANSSNTFETLNRDPVAMAAALQEWTTKQTGPLVDTILSQLAWLRLPQESDIFKRHPDPSAGPNAPHYELIFSVCAVSSVIDYAR